MKRIFLPSNKNCILDCKYCFAKWNDIYLTKNLDSCYNFENICNEDLIIIYPSCDGDFVLDQELIYNILSNISPKQTVVFSYSTKNTVSQKYIDQILEINNKIDNGFIKLSIGITTKSMIEILEPNSLTYESRIKLLQELKSYGIKTSVTIKPILPFVQEKEYFDIISDTIDTQLYLLGGLYVNPNSSFYHDFELNKYKSTIRNVSWYDNIAWNYIEKEQKTQRLKNEIERLNGKAFFSDHEIIKYILKNT